MRKFMVILLLSLIGLGARAQSDPKLSKFVTDWIGKPYRWGGYSKKGIDCSGLTRKFYADVYKVKLDKTCSDQWKQTQRIKKTQLKEGDLIFFRSNWSPSGWHCGIYLGDRKILHASSRKSGVIISDLDSTNYGGRIRGYGRYKKELL